MTLIRSGGCRHAAGAGALEIHDPYRLVSVRTSTALWGLALLLRDQVGLRGVDFGIEVVTASENFNPLVLAIVPIQLVHLLQLLMLVILAHGHGAHFFNATHAAWIRFFCDQRH